MHVLELHLQRFMLHADTKVKLPRNGVVVVTGPNGLGKSSLIEGVAVGGWGKTLRGTPPWGEDAGAVTLLTDKVQAKRTAKGSKKTITWHRTGEEPTDYESPTKANEALEQVLGAFDTWRRTHVFSSHDASHFTLATDADRKALLETVLGLYSFDRALEVCRSDRRQAETQHMQAVARLEQLRAQLAPTRTMLESAERALANAPPVPEPLPPLQLPDTTAMQHEVQELAGQILEAGKDVSAVQRTLREMELGVAKRLAKAEEFDRRLAALGSGDCDKCGQPIPAALREALTAAAQAERMAAKELQAKEAENELLLRAQVEELQAEYEALRRRKTEAETKLRVAATERQAKEAERRTHDNARAAALRATTTASASVEQARATLADLEDRIAKGETYTLDAARKRHTLETVEVVLGLKGVRAHVLGRALSGVEATANAWLARLGLNMAVELKPYTETKSGAVNDAISLNIVGAGGGYGYRAASSGQRRRIDIALLLALAEVSAAAQGGTPGTLLMDEVFDALDEDGKPAACDVIAELARDRAIVVITHDKELITRLAPVMHIHVVPDGEGAAVRYG